MSGTGSLMLQPSLTSRIAGVFPSVVGLAVVAKIIVYGDDAFLIAVVLVTAAFFQFFSLPFAFTRVSETEDDLRLRAGIRLQRVPWSEIETIRFVMSLPRIGFEPVPQGIAVWVKGDMMFVLPRVYGNAWTNPKRDEIERARVLIAEAWRRHVPEEEAAPN